MPRPAPLLLPFVVAIAFAAPPEPTPEATPESKPDHVPVELFALPANMEVNVWAKAPQLRNPTNLDVDYAGRIWVTEGVNYRRHSDRDPAGDRVMVLTDTDGDGTADSSHVFVQEPELIAPLGIAVIDNRIVVSCAPHLLVYTDVDRDLRFDPSIDKREIILTGFNGRNHDHSLHSVTVGPDGLWYFNSGNAGGFFTDRSGRTFRIGSAYEWGVEAPGGHSPARYAGATSDDGHVYVGGFAARMQPDGTGVEIIGYNFRNSYEQTVTSFGDVFQNDNDDPPACRTSYLLEYGNAGWFSRDGKRFWNADRRPGQDIPTAQWRQDDPGAMPVGDVYGAGAPTGIAFYEGELFGPAFRGTLLSCEAARNVIFGYQPQLEGAAWSLNRTKFFTTNPDERLTGIDSLRGRTNDELYSLFRPSDVVVGPDGAIYVSDWFDPRVGGHADNDDGLYGTIYRIAPTGSNPRPPEFDLYSTEGQLAALRSPAVNVRELGASRLRTAGPAALPAVLSLLKDSNPYVAARAIFLLPYVGAKGLAATRELTHSSNAEHRLTALRSLRRAGADVSKELALLANDPSAAVRRDVAVALRDVSTVEALPLLVQLARSYDGTDKTYLSAWGIGATDKEIALAEALLTAESEFAPPAFFDLLFTLSPSLDLTARWSPVARDAAAPTAQRLRAITALGFTASSAAADTMLALYQDSPDGLIRDTALWWLLNHMNDRWAATDIAAKIKAAGIYDPETAVVTGSIVPEAVPENQIAFDTVLAARGDAAAGATKVAACRICHKVGETGPDYGPDLNGWVNRQGREQAVWAIIDPSRDIAHGFDGRNVQLKDGTEVHGLVLAQGDPVVVRSMGGATQMIPRDRVKGIQWYGRSLMLSADQLGLNAQDVADIVAYLAGE